MGFISGKYLNRKAGPLLSFFFNLFLVLFSSISSIALYQYAVIYAQEPVEYQELPFDLVEQLQQDKALVEDLAPSQEPEAPSDQVSDSAELPPSESVEGQEEVQTEEGPVLSGNEGVDLPVLEQDASQGAGEPEGVEGEPEVEAEFVEATQEATQDIVENGSEDLVADESDQKATELPQDALAVQELDDKKEEVDIKAPQAEPEDLAAVLSDKKKEDEFTQRVIQLESKGDNQKKVLEGELLRRTGKSTDLIEDSTVRLAEVEIEGKQKGDPLTLQEALIPLVSLSTTDEDLQTLLLESIFEENHEVIAQTVLNNRDTKALLKDNANKKTLQTLNGKVEEVIQNDSVQQELISQLKQEPEVEMFLSTLLTQDLKEDIVKEAVEKSLHQEAPVDIQSVAYGQLDKDYEKLALSELLGQKMAEKSPSQDVLTQAVAQEVTQNKTDNIAPVLSVRATGPGGSFNLPLDQLHFEAGSVVMKLEPTRQFTPGLYRLDMELTNPITGEIETFVQDLAWGVLAMNTDRDVYKPGEEANIAIGVLDDNGKPVCDAMVNLEVVGPSGTAELLEVNNTGQCSVFDSKNTNPDYQSLYTFSQPGEYNFKLTATHSNGTLRTRSFVVQVMNFPDYVVKRTAATRLYPVGASEMTMDVYFNRDFKGVITEVLPASFEILSTDQGGNDSISEAKISSSADGKEKWIAWQVDILEGEMLSLAYQYDAPDISPEFYTLGPLRSDGNFLEKHRWEIANDEPVIAADSQSTLRGHWEMNEGTGTTTADSSSFGNTGVLTNVEAIDWVTDTPTPNNQNPYSLEMDGGEYVIITDPAGGELDFGDTEDFSLSGWFKWEYPQADNDVLLAKRTSQSAFAVGYIVYMDATDNTLVFEVSDGVDEYQIKSSSAFTKGGWHHFTAVWDQDSATNSTLYIDGVENSPTKTGTIANVGSLSNAHDLVIGAESDQQFSFFGGFDDMRVYSRALSATEISPIFSGNAPGGVSGNLQLWLKADEDVTNTGNDTDATAWGDQSANELILDHNTSTALGGTYPNYVEDVVNGHSALNFIGTTDRLGESSLVNGPTGDMFVNVVYRRNPYTGTDEAVLSYATGGSADALFLEIASDGGIDIELMDNNLDSPNVGSNDGQFHIATIRRSGSTVSTQFDGVQVASETNATAIAANGCLVFGEDQDSLCGTFSTSQDYDGDLAEVLMYNAYPAAETQQQILSYLALKYGISLVQSAAGGGIEYLDSQLNTIWATDASDVFEYNIAGIGQDDLSGLNQTSGKTSDFEGIVRMSEATSQDNLDFLTWADNNATSSWTSSGAPAGYQVLKRQWQAQETNDIGTVDIEIDTKDDQFRVPVLLAGTSYYFISDTDNDGSLSDETPVAMKDDGTGGDDTASDNKWTTQLNFPSGDTKVDFTIATQDGTVVAPGGVIDNLKFWFKANNGVTHTGNGTAATGWSGSGPYDFLLQGAVAALSLTSPTYYSSLINYNPALDFDNTTDGLGISNFHSIPADNMFITVVYERPPYADTSEALFTYSTSSVVASLEAQPQSTGKVYDKISQNDLTSLADVGADDGLPHLFTIHRDASNVHSMLFDGLSVASEANSTSVLKDGCFILGQQQVSFCGGISTSRAFEGDIAEIVAYDAALTTTQKGQILSYLALKYGITLDQSVASGGVSYLNSSGGTIWAVDTSDTFEKAVAGIGRDDLSQFNQVQSKSAEIDSILRVADATSQDDLDFLTWANNNGAATWTATGAPTGYQILSRIWEGQETGDLATVDLEFDAGDTDFDLPTPLDAGSYYFVYDSDHDNSLSDETPVAMKDNGTGGDDTSSDNKWTAQLNFPLDVIDGKTRFTVATSVSTPPTVTDANISINSGSGIAGAFIVGDQVVVTWDNSVAGDNNSGITSASADLSGWGSLSTIMTDTTDCGGTSGDDIYEACYTLVSGSIDNTNVNTTVQANSAGGSDSDVDTSNATVDNQPPNITGNGTLTISTDNGVIGVAALNDGSSNQDKVTQSAVTLSTNDGDTSTINLSTLTGQSALVLATQSGVIVPGSLDSASETFTITVTDNAGNVATIASDSISVDNIVPTLTVAKITVTGASASGGIFRYGDSATGRWNNSASGDNNSDITSVSFDLSDFRSVDTALSGSNSLGIWTASITGALDSQGDFNNNTTVTVTDDAGNIVSLTDTSNYTVDTISPTIDSITSVATDTTPPYYDSSNDSSTAIVFSVSETGTGINFCRWDEANVAYSLMSNICASTTNCTANLAGEGSKTVYLACTDGAGNSTPSNTQVDYTVDVGGPTGTSLTPNSLRIIDNSYPSFIVDDGTDAGSGVDTASRLLERADATYTSNTCGSFGSFAPVTYSGTYPNISDTTVTGSACYKYRYSVSDNAANTTTTAESSTLVRVPLTTLVITGGNNQSYGDSSNNPIGYSLPTALQVQVTDGGTNWALADEVTVDFALTSVPATPTATGQSLSVASANTDVNGYAQTSLTLGDRAGDYLVQASSAHSSITVEPTFTETAGEYFTLVITQDNVSIDLNPLSNPSDFASPTLTVTTNAASYEVSLTPNQWPTSIALDEILNWSSPLGFGWNLNLGTVTAFMESLGLPALTSAYSCSGDTCQGPSVINIDLYAGIDHTIPPGTYTSDIQFSGENIVY